MCRRKNKNKKIKFPKGWSSLPGSAQVFGYALRCSPAAGKTRILFIHILFYFTYFMHIFSTNTSYIILIPVNSCLHSRKIRLSGALPAARCCWRSYTRGAEVYFAKWLKTWRCAFLGKFRQHSKICVKIMTTHCSWITTPLGLLKL
jgi:hypothetical protein